MAYANGVPTFLAFVVIPVILIIFLHEVLVIVRVIEFIYEKILPSNWIAQAVCMIHMRTLSYDGPIRDLFRLRFYRRIIAGLYGLEYQKFTYAEIQSIDFAMLHYVLLRMEYQGEIIVHSRTLDTNEISVRHLILNQVTDQTPERLKLFGIDAALEQFDFIKKVKPSCGKRTDEETESELKLRPA